MSIDALRRTDDALAVFATGLLLAIAASALLYFTLGIDLIALDGFGIPCIFHALTGIACPGCGMTHALVLLSQGQWAPAFHANPFVGVLVVGAAVSIVRRVCRATPGKCPAGVSRRIVRGTGFPRIAPKARPQSADQAGQEVIFVARARFRRPKIGPKAGLWRPRGSSEGL